ncbi:MAG: hypothetical protein OQJ84_04285 [Xanthomonadales bacterium]|nr:hypothetical protein [Xanthomonadales bacterium]
MNYRLPLIFILFCVNSAWADFSQARFQTHPIEPAGRLGPYLIEITGEWSTDCHPGEQKPVIREFTGDTALIEFEIIVEHVTCNDVATPYRVLIDMSDVIDGGVNNPPGIEVTIRFGGVEHTELVSLLCICSPAPVGPDIKPEPGVYEGEGLEKQGILLARQNDRMGVYPLIYDEAGNSQWLFGGGGIVEDVYFVKLKELSDGQCLGCPPPGDPPQKEVVGKLAMLMDSEGLIQVKVNDGLFVPYDQLEFGYGDFLVGWGMTGVRIPNLTGRWAFSDVDNHSHRAITTTPPSSVLPLVFDVIPTENANWQATRKSKDNPPVPQLTPAPPGNVRYTIFNIEGEQAAEMLCDYRGEMICDLKNPDFTDFDHWYEIRMLSLERMIMTNMAEPGEGEGVGAGIAVRID